MENLSYQIRNQKDISAILTSKVHQEKGMRAFFNLAAKWKLSPTEASALLGSPGERTYYNWKSGKLGLIPQDTMRRIGMIMGVHKALRLIYSNPENIYGWVRQPNQLLNGQTPLERMVGGDYADIAFIHSYLNSVRG